MLLLLTDPSEAQGAETQDVDLVAHPEVNFSPASLAPPDFVEVAGV